MRKAAESDAPRQRLKARGQCACGTIAIEIDAPAQWAWHDHSAETRRAHGAAYATYVGSWRSRLRFLRGEDALTHYTEPHSGATRSFCARCGSPVAYVRKRSPKNINIPRALFDTGVGREPRYHIAIDQMPEWAYSGESLSPLKGYPGVVWNRGRKRKASGLD